MNQINRSSRIAKKTQDIHPLVAALDENDADQQRLRDLIRRFHSGRWPLFRCLGMRQINGIMFEAVEWLRMKSPRFGLVEWHSDGLGMQSQRKGSAQQAKRALFQHGV